MTELDWESLLANARLLREAGRPQEALQHCDRAALLDESGRYHAACLRGHILLELGDAQGALSCFESVALLDEVDPNIDCFRGLALFELGRFSEAQSALKSGIRDDPNQAEAHYTLGLISELCGSGDESQHFRQARLLDEERFPGTRFMSQEEFMVVLEEAVSALPEVVVRELEKHPLLVSELPIVDHLRRPVPPVSPLSLAIVVGGTTGAEGEAMSDPMVEGELMLLLFKRNLERAFQGRNVLVEGLRNTVLREYALALGWVDEDEDMERAKSEEQGGEQGGGARGDDDALV